MHNRLEALADAIATLNRMGDPESEAYQCRNPLMLGAFALRDDMEMNERGIRKFGSLLGGYRAGLFDLEQKCQGRTRATSVRTGSRLRSSSQLDELLACYGHKDEKKMLQAVTFINCALGQPAVDLHTQLSWFVVTAEFAGRAGADNAQGNLRI